MEIKTLDRTQPARQRRAEEYFFLLALPYHTKEQKSRFDWLKRQRIEDKKAAREGGK